MTVVLFSDYSLEDYKKCVAAGVKIGANIKGVYLSVGAEGGSCDGLLNEIGGEVPCFMKTFAVCKLYSTTLKC